MALIAFPIALVIGLVVGFPVLLLCRKLNLLSWGHAVSAGMLVPMPLLVPYLLMNPTHTEHVGLYNSVFVLGLGGIAGLTAWVVGIFRNPVFMESNASLPRSLLLTVPLFAAGYFYYQALEPVYHYGRIAAYEPAAQPSPWKSAYVTVVTDSGESFRSGIPRGYSKPEIVGNCAWYSKKRVATLHRYFYSVHSVDSNGCKTADE